MAEDKKPADDAAQQPQAGLSPDGAEGSPPGMRIMAQYVKDLSFENPKAPESLRAGQAQPKIDVQVELGARSREDGLHEVDLRLIAKASRDDEPVYHAEVLYGGIFAIEGVPPEHMEAMTMIEGPRFLFPFARRLIADLTMEGGFQPFHIQPIDFGAIYMARAQQQAAQQGAPTEQA